MIHTINLVQSFWKKTHKESVKNSIGSGICPSIYHKNKEMLSHSVLSRLAHFVIGNSPSVHGVVGNLGNFFLQKTGGNGIILAFYTRRDPRQIQG
jgi:hypothetical protein